MSANMQTTSQKAHLSAQTENTAGPREAAIVVENFSKSYGSRRVVNRVHFTVYRGEVFVLLGPNGAGPESTDRSDVATGWSLSWLDYP